jgi:4-hydroxy-3-methylbut-2-en-1-yl diphosphate reductase
MKITIDHKAGYCFGVKNAIGQAEAMLDEDGTLHSLGHIVHNHGEVNRLADKGLKVIDYNEFSKLRNCKVLIRAHGEPPSTYETAYRNNITLIDATCPIVKHLQGNIRTQNDLSTETNSQVVIYGKMNHPEVNGLVGQTGGQAIVVSVENDIENIDPQKAVHLYAQTTLDPQGFDLIASQITAYLERHHTGNAPQVIIHNTICRQVSNRISHLEKFAGNHQVIVFVSGKSSSNGRFLYNVCLKSNPKTYHIEEANDIDLNWFDEIETVGITGATSTPAWQMKKVADFLGELKTK